MATIPSTSARPSRPQEQEWFTLLNPACHSAIAASANIKEAVALLREEVSLSAVELPKTTLNISSVLTAYVTDCNEFSLIYDGKDSGAFYSYFERNLKHYGFPEEIRNCLLEHTSRLYKNFRDATNSEGLVSFLMLRRPRTQPLWHIDHYRPQALQFVTTLAGYPNTPFLLPSDYSRSAFEQLRRKLFDHQSAGRTLTDRDESLSSLKVAMNRLAEGQTPRFTHGDILFRGEELLHASPQSPVSRLIFAMSSASTLQDNIQLPSNSFSSD